MTVAGLLYGPNASLMVTNETGELPSIHGGVVRLGAPVCSLSGGPLFQVRARGLPWRGCSQSRTVSAGPFLVFLSIDSWAFHLLSGAYDCYLPASPVVPSLILGVLVGLPRVLSLLGRFAWRFAEAAEGDSYF